ncbi:unnamed protein product [Blepharisma stoltei]|uniref:Uncharacterized protein n=1 Tax=Blepharisma stoltei TaxID=1481888 RepID=A0AAU9K178_9CILI|nr:unnamed protein product [Blepharisma stoltei]
MNILDDCVRSLQARPSPHVLRCILNFIKEKRHTAEDALKALGSSGISQLFEWLYSDDVELRKVSALFICELAYDNHQAQIMICQAMNYTPLQGKVCINKLPKRIETLIKERPELLKLLKKVESDKVKYWSFPPLDQMTYKSSLENLFFFPDPMEYMLGFLAVPAPTRPKFLNTTTSYFSDDFESTDNSEDIKDRSNTMVRKNLEALKEPASYSPKMYNYDNQEMIAGPVEVNSPRAPMFKPLTPKMASHQNNFDGIEASINRIKGALKELAQPTSTRAYSPNRNYLSPTRASALKTRDRSNPKPSQSPDIVLLSTKRKELTSKLEKLIRSPLHSPNRRIH